MSGPRRMRDQLRALNAAIMRTEERIGDMTEQWRQAGAICCPGCMFGAQYIEQVRKQNRQEAWREILIGKIAKAKESAQRSLVERVIERIFGCPP